MDYGRLFLFLVGTAGAMAILTHVTIWLCTAVRNSVLRREALRFTGRDRSFLEAIAEDGVDARRSSVKPYVSFGEFMEAARGEAPLDEILDRCAGKVPGKASTVREGLPLPVLVGALFLLPLLGVMSGLEAMKVLGEAFDRSPGAKLSAEEARKKLSEIRDRISRESA